MKLTHSICSLIMLLAFLVICTYYAHACHKSFLTSCVCIYIYIGWAKKNHKTETFLLVGKIVKNLIITGISIMNSIIMRWETILWWAEGIFLQKLRKQRERYIFYLFKLDVNGCFDFFLSLLSVCVYKTFPC